MRDGVSPLVERCPFRVHYIGYFSKRRWKPAKFDLESFATEFEIPARDPSVFISCWAFVRRLSSRFLAGPSSSRMGKRPAFFVFGRCLMRRIVNPPRGHPMLLPDSSNILHLLYSGRPNVRMGSICLYQGDILNQPLSNSLIRNVSSRPDFRSAGNINTYHADMGISVPVPAFFVPGTHIPVDNFSANWILTVVYRVQILWGVCPTRRHRAPWTPVSFTRRNGFWSLWKDRRQTLEFGSNTPAKWKIRGYALRDERNYRLSSIDHQAWNPQSK